MAEYDEVLHRDKFNFSDFTIGQIIVAFSLLGESWTPTPFTGELPDPKDRIFYEISLTGDNFLVTGNLKHFPSTPKVVSPAQMMEIIDSMYL